MISPLKLLVIVMIPITIGFSAVAATTDFSKKPEVITLNCSNDWSKDWGGYTITQNNCLILNNIQEQNDYIIEQNEIIIKNQEILKCYEQHKETQSYWYENGFGKSFDQNANTYKQLVNLCGE